MEDISRELEREIALSKPKPYKQDRKTRILIIDDFGQMKPGEHLKTLVKILSVTSIVFFIAAGLFYFLYTGLFRDVDTIRTRLVSAEKKAKELVSEKEMLMARLVIQGKEPGIAGQKPEKKVPPSAAAIEEKKPIVSKHPDIKPVLPETENTGKSEKVSDKVPMAAQQKAPVETEEIVETPPPAVPAQPEPVSPINKTVSIEKFTVVEDGTNGDLLVRFDIRNISTGPGDVSGRIFTVLKPDSDSEDQWLVVPAAALKKGVPSEYKKGQYFSIAHFKPVKFRIKNKARPDFFKKASIFIFNEQAQLIFEELIDITAAAESAE